MHSASCSVFNTRLYRAICRSSANISKWIYFEYHLRCWYPCKRFNRYRLWEQTCRDLPSDSDRDALPGGSRCAVSYKSSALVSDRDYHPIGFVVLSGWFCKNRHLRWTSQASVPSINRRWRMETPETAEIAPSAWDTSSVRVHSHSVEN